jgi:hypothetical protein
MHREQEVVMQEAQRNENSDFFKVVSIFHYVLGGFQMLFSLIGVLYIVMGILMTSGSLEPSKSSAPPEAIGWIFSGIGVVITLMFLSIGLLSIKTGKNLSRRRNRTFCIVVDAILCLMVPFGTIVGIFGLVLLMKPESQELFTG